MSTIGLNNVLATQSAADNLSSTATDKVQSQKNMFLNLLIKQLQYQDPMNPVENTEFASQLAQFSQLEAMTDMSSNILEMTQYQNSMNSMQAASFIGKQVSASGNTIAYSGGESSIDFNLEGNTSNVTVTIYNSQGTIVRTMNMKDVLEGDATCTWDGKDNGGDAVNPGTYYFSLNATDYSGAAVNSTTYANGTVTGIKFVNGTIYLQVGDKQITLSQITSISG